MFKFSYKPEFLSQSSNFSNYDILLFPQLFFLTFQAIFDTLKFISFIHLLKLITELNTAKLSI